MGVLHNMVKQSKRCHWGIFMGAKGEKRSSAGADFAETETSISN